MDDLDAVDFRTSSPGENQKMKMVLSDSRRFPNTRDHRAYSLLYSSKFKVSAKGDVISILYLNPDKYASVSIF